MVAGMVLLVAFIGLGVATTGKHHWERPLWSVLGTSYFVAAAGLGAIFAGLFRAYRELADATYDPRNEGSVWILVVLGLIAGTVLSTVIPESNVGGANKLHDDHGTLTVLALVGGFSARAVHQILERIVDAVVALFGTPDKVQRPQS
jgi:hypothetical protein